MIALLLLLWIEGRTYHGVSVAALKETQWTHVAVCGQVTLVKVEADGDVHLRISDGTDFIVAEIVPYHPLPVPQKYQYVQVAGISRYDRQHSWWEIHPLEQWSAVDSCLGIMSRPSPKRLSSIQPYQQHLSNLGAATDSHQRINRHHPSDGFGSTKSNDVDRLVVRDLVRRSHADVATKERRNLSGNVPVRGVESNSGMSPNADVSISK